ncbi:hypothetical protein [Arthrobacter sp. Marseille-P9274]|uniref:hypothetical protein n=1 Tax=Arthrobacter sp. Marseille-P9274 TaxID=2866572 RepID=UPI0021C712FB|nr:hypothetical protein [Arthrobacter sp. Marseille-P9274]
MAVFKDQRQVLTDPASPAFGIVSTAAIGGLTLIDPAKLSPQQLQALRVATAAVTGLYTAATIGRGRVTLVPFNLVAGLAAGAATLRFAELTEALDARAIRTLHGVGVTRRRPWLAAGSAALTFAMFLLDRAAARRQEHEAVTLEDLEQLRPVTPAVRDLAEGILRAADVPGADALLAQLQQAQEIYWEEDFVTTAQFKVPDGLPRAVPHTQVFPVTARFEAENGVPLQVTLQVYNGKLDHLAIEAVDETEESADDVVDAWPEPNEVQYFIEGPGGGAAPVSREPGTLA